MYKTVDLKGIACLMNDGFCIEDVLSDMDWKYFESVVSSIFEINGYRVKKNVRFKTHKRYEIDVVASNPNIGRVFSVDCKRWSYGRSKESALKKASKEQLKRTLELKRFVERNPIAKFKMRISEGSELIPALVTLLEEDATNHLHDIIETEVIRIPVWKLNSFLNLSL